MNANIPPDVSRDGGCGAVREQLPLLIYGELSFDEEERAEVHLESCSDCRAALARERELMAVFDQVAVEPSPALLMQCRESFAARLETEPAPERSVAGSWWDRVLETLTPRVPAAWMKPAGAFALLAMGFLGARLMPNVGPGGFGAMSFVDDPDAARVRYVEQAPDGQVQIVLDEMRQRVVMGRLEDDNIRSLLLTAARDSDSGLRGQTVELLTSRAQVQDVRNALVYTIRNDQNDGVRLRAMNGLRSFVAEPDVRGALAEVLLEDANPGMRSQAIDMLIEGLMEGPVQAMDRQMIGIFQELMSREENPYLRQRCQRVLEQLNASPEIY